VTSRSSGLLALALAAMGIAAAVPVGRIAERVIPSPHAPVGYLYAGLLIGGHPAARSGCWRARLCAGPPAHGELLHTLDRPARRRVHPAQRDRQVGHDPAARRLRRRDGSAARQALQGAAPGARRRGPIAVIIVVEDLGTGVLVAVSLAVLLLAAGAKISTYLAFAPFAALGVVAAIVESPYRLERITSLLQPVRRRPRVGIPDDPVHGHRRRRGPRRKRVSGTASRSSATSPRTPPTSSSRSSARRRASPAPPSSSPSTSSWRGRSSASSETRPPPSSALRRGRPRDPARTQAIINLVVVTGLGPTKGIALPLLSSGGTGWVLTAASLGLVIAIDRDTRAGLEASPILERPPRASPLPAPA
jgi:hypothetical protein